MLHNAKYGTSQFRSQHEDLFVDYECTYTECVKDPLDINGFETVGALQHHVARGEVGPHGLEECHEHGARPAGTV